MTFEERPRRPEEDAERLNEKQRSFRSFRAAAYEARWERVEKHRIALYPDLIEAEAVWDDELKRLFDDLHRHTSTLKLALISYLLVCDPDTPENLREDQTRIMRDRDKIIHALGTLDEPDEYWSQFICIASRIEGYLKGKLSRV